MKHLLMKVNDEQKFTIEKFAETFSFKSAENCCYKSAIIREWLPVYVPVVTVDSCTGS